MNVIVPAAGRGTRLRPLTLDRPKPLLHVGGGTLLTHALAPLRRLAVDRLVFIVGDGGEDIRRFVDSAGVRAEFVHQPEPLGQAHALSLARRWLDGPVLIVFPDMVFDADLETATAHDHDGFLFARRVEDPRRFGVVTTDDHGYATGFVEKPAAPVSDRAIVGVYYLLDGAWLAGAIDEQLERGSRTRGEYYLADALEIMIGEGARLQVRDVTVWEDCGTIEDMLATNRYLLERLGRTDPVPEGSLRADATPSSDDPARQASPPDGARIAPPVHIDPTATVSGCALGPNTFVGPGCRLEGCTIGPAVYVGPGCHVADSELGPHVSLEGDCRVARSRLSDAVVGRHAVLERSEVASSLLGTHVELRGVRLITHLGDYSRVGAGGYE